MSRRKIKAKQPKKKQHDFDNVVPFETPSMRAVEGSISDFMGESDSSEPRDRAQQLIYDAWEETNRRMRRKLIKQALEIYPDCVDAFVCLAEDSHDPEEAIPFYERALEAGERDLGSKMFVEDAGHFWGILDTRPYMRAKEGLAMALHAVGRIDEAVENYQEMLRLNPNDNQGIRMELLPLLLELGKDGDADRLLKMFKGDVFSTMIYGDALLEFRKSGDSKKAKKKLVKALEANEHVPAYLTGRRKMPRRLPEYHGFGDENEAAIVAIGLREAWKKTPGALGWLEERSLR